MSKLIIIGVVIIIAIVGGIFWFQKNNSTQPTSTKAENRTLTISGSASGVTLMQPIIMAFEKRYPNTKVKLLPGTETADGIKGVAEGLLDIGSAARPLKKEEEEKYPKIQYLAYVKDAMVLGVNQNVIVDSLTKDQVSKIHSGAITDWSQVGGQKGKIVVFDREETESSKIILRKYILGSDLKIGKNVILMHDSTSLQKGIIDTENSIGQTSLGADKLENLNIKAIAIDKVIPNITSIKDGTYEMVRSYGVIIPKGELTGTTKDFVDFLFSNEAKKMFEASEMVSLPRS